MRFYSLKLIDFNFLKFLINKDYGFCKEIKTELQFAAPIEYTSKEYAILQFIN